jgi:acetyltransferase
LAVVTNAGGPGVLAADSIISVGGELSELSPETLEQLNKTLPPHWSHNNPVDVLGDALPDRYAKVLEIVAADANNDGLLAVLCPQGMSHPTLTAERLAPLAKSTGKPVLACWMGGSEMSAGTEILNRAGIPTFAFPDAAARIFYYMWRYSYLVRGLYETPVLPHDEGDPDRVRAEAIIESVRASGRTLLTEPESKELLACYHIPTAPTLEAHSADEAAARADELGYPVVVKLLSHTITHKTEVGGVKLNLSTPDAVRNAWREIETSVREKAGAEHFLGVTVQPFFRAEGYELILGSTVDAQFGPVMLFGTGGQLVEVFGDRALALPPLTTTLARRFMEQTKIFKALQGVRGRQAVDMPALEELLVRFSQLVAEQRWMKEIDINPLLASPDRLIALDARVVLYPKDTKKEDIPRLAIRPYPKRYVRTGAMKNGEEILVRPIRPEDEPLLVKLHQVLSERTVYLRYFQPLRLSQRTAHDRLTRICYIDYDREMALVVEHKNAEGNPELIAIGRLSRLRGRDEGEMAVLVDDRFQHQGLGTELYRRLVEVARDELMGSVVSTILSENREMQTICKKLGFYLESSLEDGTVMATLKL